MGGWGDSKCARRGTFCFLMVKPRGHTLWLNEKQNNNDKILAKSETALRGPVVIIRTEYNVNVPINHLFG